MKDDFLKDSLQSFIKESSTDFYKQKFVYGIKAKFIYSIKSLISILESSKDDETRLKLRQSYLITQQSLFVEDFDKSLEKFIKELPIANFC